MTRRKANWKKLDAWNRTYSERCDALWAEVAAKKRAASDAASDDAEVGAKPARRRFKVRMEPKFLDEKALAERWNVPESRVRKMGKSGNGPLASGGEAGISYRLRDVRKYERASAFPAQIGSHRLM